MLNLDTNSDEQPMEGHETVLVAEDEPDLRAIICDTLRLNGYGVLVARHGIEALLVARQHLGPIHLLLTDVVMPQMSGRELAESLVAARTEMKVMYMSGYTSDAVLHRGVVAQGTNFLQKPFTISTLLRTIRRTLADRHALSSHIQVRPPHTKKEQHGTA